MLPLESHSPPQTAHELDWPPDQARIYVDMLAFEALGHDAVCHPYLRALATGDVPDLRWAITDFARHYSGYSIHFRRYLTTAISRLDDPRHGIGLLENLAEESGNYGADELAELAAIGIEPEWIVGIPHPELFRRFCAALGLPHRRDEEANEVVRWRESFLNLLAHGSAAEAVGGLGLGTENIVKTIYQPLVDAIARLPGLEPYDTVFFPLHTAVDDHHTETLQTIAAELARSEAGRRGLRHGMFVALGLRSNFWDWLYERALCPEQAERQS